MSYETSQADEATASQRVTDTSEYTALENQIPNLVNQITAWHADGQALATASTQNPGDTTDLNALRVSLESQIAAILTVVFT